MPAAHYIDISGIQKVEMNNVNGEFRLNPKQLIRFKKELTNASTVPGLAIKTGSLAIILTLADGSTYVMRGNSSSQFLEISTKAATLHVEELKGLEWLVLTTNEVNYNNYKKR